MTNATPVPADLAEVVSRTRYLLLDFDGPICSIFSGLHASSVASQLRKLFTGQQIPLPVNIAESPDPIEVFTYAATVSPELAAQIEAEMTELEITATATARPTPHVRDVIAGCRESGRTIAVVSNNSARAVSAYLIRHDLAGSFAAIVARTSPDPELLKPSPHLIEAAVSKLDTDSAAATLVGDSITDIQAARLAGVNSIGYANKPGKYKQMTAERAGAVINSMSNLALTLRTHPLAD